MSNKIIMPTNPQNVSNAYVTYTQGSSSETSVNVKSEKHAAEYLTGRYAYYYWYKK